jgi:hypothetical protein
MAEISLDRRVDAQEEILRILRRYDIDHQTAMRLLKELIGVEKAALKLEREAEK